MNFQIWLEQKEKPIIFVDLDETLLSTVYLQNAGGWIKDKEEYYKISNTLNYWKQRGEKIIKQGKDTFLTRMRPHADTFLNKLKKLGEVYVLTSGRTEFQQKVAKLHGFDVPVIGKDKYNLVPKSENPILIDDLPIDSGGAHEKLEAIGGKISNYVKVNPWFGDNPNDNELIAIFPQILKII